MSVAAADMLARIAVLIAGIQNIPRFAGNRYRTTHGSH
jgi:hypothetical protein